MQRKRTRRMRYRPGRRGRAGLSARVITARRRYRVVDRRRFMIAQGVLALVAVVALGLSASVIVRSLRTANLNRELVRMYEISGDAMEAAIAAPPIDPVAFDDGSAYRSFSSIGELSAMVLPDGSPIPVPEETLVPASTSYAQTAARSTVFYRTDLEILPEMRELALKNPDTMGWISISGTVHLPVVYRDNTYYLDHDFTGAQNASGTLFLDESAPVSAQTQNLLIHGHAMNDGSMFGILTHYRRLEFLKQHPLITFSTLWEKNAYAVFAVLQVSSKVGDPDYFNYFSSATFASDADFDAYIAQVEARSQFSVPIDVRPTDAMITLSTCLDDDRLVVLARRLRDEETKDEIISAVEASYAT